MSQVVPIEVARRPRVVIGVDGSEPSATALRRSLDVLQAVGAELVVVFVRQLPYLGLTRFSGDALEVLAEGLDALVERTHDEVKHLLEPAGVRWRFEVREGDPATRILELAHEEDAVAIVIGATIHGAITSMMLSSVAAQLLHHSDVSVVVVRPERRRD